MPATTQPHLSALHIETPAPERPLPLVLAPDPNANPDLVAAIHSNKQTLEQLLLQAGALLFRGFDIASPERLDQVVRVFSGQPMEYRERSSPRHEVSQRIFTSTDHPPSQKIFLHNEHSYSKIVPLRLYFCCSQAATSGGETPLADVRRVYARLPSRILERFDQVGWMYVRNFNDGFGLTWQTVFQTDDPAAVENYCRANTIRFEWKSGERLRTHQVRPVVALHPKSDERVWFNHATFFNVSTLPPALRLDLLELFAEEDLPNNTYYGDGSPIETSVLDELRVAYEAEERTFSWQRGDLLLIDNMLTAHARNPFTGPRQILVAMAEPHTRFDF